MNIHGPILQDLIDIRQAALHAVDPKDLVARAIESNSGVVRFAAGPLWKLGDINSIYLVSVGKAAHKMAAAVVKVVGPHLREGIVISPHGNPVRADLPECLCVLDASHPIPDENGLSGARRIISMLQNTTPEDRVIVLLSGGASALTPAPVPALSLQDLQAITELLLRSGATIHELNTVRKHIDRIKGGQLVREASPAPVISLILSDVVGDDLSVIASAPTVPDPSTYSDALKVLEKFELTDRAPHPVVDHLLAGQRGEVQETPKPGDPLFGKVTNILVGSNRVAAEAALAEATRLGYNSLLLTTFLEGEAREVGKVIAGIARSIRFNGNPIPPPACVVFGGETTVTVRGHGTGGRNQELALSASLSIEGLPNLAIMALATDGADGATDAAGAIVTGDTLKKIHTLSLDCDAALLNNDSYSILNKTGDLLVLGPTGTNVNDIIVVLVR